MTAHTHYFHGKKEHSTTYAAASFFMPGAAARVEAIIARKRKLKRASPPPPPEISEAISAEEDHFAKAADIGEHGAEARITEQAVSSNHEQSTAPETEILPRSPGDLPTEQ